MHETKCKEHMLVVCCNSNGEPDVFQALVECTADEFYDGDADLVAMSMAEAAGYSGPLIVLDRTSPGWGVLRKVFAVTADAYKVEELALVFARNLRTTLGVLMPAVIWRNERRREITSGFCASHDFCDANRCMLEALSEVARVPEDYLDLEENMDVMNQAWDLAKKRHFWVPQPDSIINIAR